MRVSFTHLLAVGALVVTALARPSVAQTGAPAAGPSALNPATTSLSVGYFNTSFEFASRFTGYAHRFVGPAATVMLSGDASSLSVAYGTDDPRFLRGAGADSTLIEPGRKMLDVGLSTGGNPTIASLTLPVPLRVFIPIRLQLGYRNLRTDTLDARGNELAALNLASAGLGAGAGASVRIPTGLPVLQDRLVGTGSLVVAFGGMAEFGGSDQPISGDQIHLTRTTDFNLEARAERVLGNLGATIGYTYRTTFWSDDYIADVEGTVETLSDLNNFSQRSRQHLLRLGINW